MTWWTARFSACLRVRRSGVVLLVGLSPLLVGTPAVSRELPVVTLESTSACPLPAEVARALAPLLPNHRLLVGTAEGAQQVRLSDEGEHYRLQVGNSERLIWEPARQCINRARAAAVVIALAVEERSEP